MSDYLNNLVARSLEPTPAIQPRLASLFEPLSAVGPLFPRPGRVVDRFERIAARDEAAPDALIQRRADHDPGTEPPISSSTTTLINIGKESSDLARSKAPPQVSDQQRKPVAATMKPAESEPRIPQKIADDVTGRELIASASQTSAESKAKTVVPVIGVPLSSESSHRDQRGWPEKETTRREVAVTLVAGTYEARRPRETAGPENKLGERRGPESSSASAPRDGSTVISSLSQNDQTQSSSSLVVPRAAIETIRADRGSLSPLFVPETAAPRDAMAPPPISKIKLHQDSRRRPDDTEADEQVGPATEPSINVTIGRVEVRALLPTASRPARKDSGSPKLMGLDDYLRQRAQGGKR